MNFLRTLLWVVLAVLGVIFAFNNAQLVEVRLWGDLLWTPPVWFAMLVAFLLGLVPALVLHRTTRWSLRRKLDAVTRSQADLLRNPAGPTNPVNPPSTVSISQP